MEPRSETTQDRANDYILRAVLESPRDIVIFALDRRYQYLAFNEAHRRTMKQIWQADIAVGRSMLEFIVRDDDRAKAKQNFDRALAGEHFSIVEEYGEERLTRRYYEDVYSPILAEDGSVVGLTLFLTDITEQKRNEDELARYRARLEALVDERTAALRRSEALYRTLVENAPVGVMVHRDGKLLFASPAAVTLYGRSGGDLVRQPIAELLAGEDVARPGEGLVRHESSFVRPDGTRVFLEWTTIDVEFGDRPARLSLVVDVTARRRTEEERRRLEEQIVRTQKLESLGVLAGGIAHDFNNLLVGIIGNAELALRSIGSAADLNVLLQRIKGAAVHASELTGQMLAYSGKGRFVVRPFDVSNVVREMSELVTVSIPETTRLDLDLASDLPAVEGDAGQVRQVVMNLIANAAEAIEDRGGTITVRTACVMADRELLASSHVDDALSPGRYVRLEVRDTGVGMDADTRAKLFDPFFTTKPKGHGLGLAAVLGIVRAHGGAITVSSEPGRGSTFCVYLPTTDRPLVEPAAPPTPLEWHATGTILVADDEPRVRQVLSLMLQDVGFRVLEADTAQRCLEVFHEHEGEVDALMVDLTMPGGGGREVVRVLRAEGHTVPIVVSSGYAEDVIGPDLRRDPSLVFLEKPFDHATFVRTLRAVLPRS